MLAFLVTGCTNTDGNTAQIESGTLDEEYSGIVDYDLEKKYKISEEELIESMQQVEMQEEDTHETGEDDTRPKI